MCMPTRSSNDATSFLKLRPVHLASPLEPNVDVKILHAKIGELTLENDFLSGALGKAGLLPSARK